VAGGNIDTTVTFTLTGNTQDGTTLRLRQAGFHGLGAQLTRRILASGYGRILGRALPAHLDTAAGRPAPPVPRHAAGWRPYLGVVRRWR
jgi:hypothetical protein